MKLHIVARGKIGRGPEAELIARYAKRITWPLQITELPEVGGKELPLSRGRTIALDEGGELLRSSELATLLQDWRDAGVPECRFMIGAADGLTAAERSAAHRTVALGRATWPHLLVRAMLVEQIYRATSIIGGHPYHRGG